MNQQSLVRVLEQLERRIAALEQRVSATPHRPAVSSGGGKISEVLADTREDLEEMTLTEGAWCRTTGAVKRAYRYLEEMLICYTHTETS